jgi:coenzyme F420-reducing hydrogenase alpha subunit
MHLQGLGNEIMALLGGRAVHPVGVCVGGFYRAPDPADVAALRQRLLEAIPQAEELVRWLGGLALPDDEQTFTSVALSEPQGYAIEQGRLVSDGGLDIGIDAFDDHFREQQSPHSTAFHAYLHGQPYLVGPLARLNCSHDRLPEDVRRVMAEAGLSFPSRNMFHSAAARAVEILYALHEAAALLADYAVPERPRAPVTPRAGVGFGATEAPRGVLWHRYETDDDGRIQSARIVPPTSQNQARIESDLRRSLEHFGLDHADDELRLRGEMVIRNYDPCISCATHFLTLNAERR